LLVALDNDKEGFARELKNLDKITSKTCDTCHIFYVKSGQKRSTDILENTVRKTCNCIKLRKSILYHFVQIRYLNQVYVVILLNYSIHLAGLFE